MSTVNAIGLSSNSTNESSVLDRIPKQTLGQEDFLKLLVAQMSAQDPLNPQKDTDFIAQMASFSSLEQSKAMQEDLAGLRADQQVLQANALLGRLVVLQSGDGSEIVGEVSAVQVHSGKVEIVVDGNSYQLNQLSAIVPKPVDSQPQE
jgi:flagellar basal-body rod modification protein FlgD